MNQQGVVEKKIWVTLAGLPLTMTSGVAVSSVDVGRGFLGAAWRYRA